MTNGTRATPLTESTESERALAVCLIALAGTIMTGISTVAIVSLPSMEPGSKLLSLSLAGAVIIAMTVSMLFGGRGIAYGPGRTGFRDRFNLQTVFGVLGIIGIIVFGFTVKLGEKATEYDVIAERLDKIEQRLETLEDQNAYAAERGETRDLYLQDLATRVEEVEARIETMVTTPESSSEPRSDTETAK